jgi:hypothetical protein
VELQMKVPLSNRSWMHRTTLYHTVICGYPSDVRTWSDGRTIHRANCCVRQRRCSPLGGKRRRLCKRLTSSKIPHPPTRLNWALETHGVALLELVPVRTQRTLRPSGGTGVTSSPGIHGATIGRDATGRDDERLRQHCGKRFSAKIPGFASFEQQMPRANR